jgi:methyltransferase (TIGR00027 family)
MLDAEQRAPVCGDVYAKLFMSGEGLAIFENFRDMKYANDMNVARPRIIDDFIRQRLLANPELQIVLIGAGFDSRAYRMQGGVWIELDEPAVIDLKNNRLPADECKNTLHRIAIDFQTESLEEKLSPFTTDQPVVVVIEGVFMYLSEQVITQVIHTLNRLFQSHLLICDLMDLGFFKKYAEPTSHKLEALGARFTYLVENPDQLFIDNGYQQSEKFSIASKASEYGGLKIPRLLLNWFMPKFRSGYCIYVFSNTQRLEQ